MNSPRSSVLGVTFFDRSAHKVAKELLGMYLVRRTRGVLRAYRITEVEVYDGPHDRASHASKGRTERTQVMFGPAGHWYVYLCYGMYWMLNIVTGKEGYPAAVLIRGVEGHSGPGRLTRALHITKCENAAPASPETGLWIEDKGERVRPRDIVPMPRVGVAYAGEWAKKPWRYILMDAGVQHAYAKTDKH